MKKWHIYSLVFFLFLFLALSKQADAFPNDATEFTFDSSDNTTCTSTTATLMPAVAHDRTLLYFTINNLSAKSNNGADVHLYDYGRIYPNQFVDNEKQTYTANYLAHVVPANRTVTCQKGTTAGERTDHIFFRIIYTDYNLASTTPSFACTNCAGATAGTSTPATSTMITSIENIGYRATTTAISAGVTVTDGIYTVPAILLKFVISIVVMTSLTIIIYLFYKRMFYAD